jgi:hypothetical protein
MPNRKFDVGSTVRLNKQMPLNMRTAVVKPGVYGKVVAIDYDEISQHTIYTVKVGSKKVQVRSTALNSR